MTPSLRRSLVDVRTSSLDVTKVLSALDDTLRDISPKHDVVALLVDGAPGTGRAGLQVLAGAQETGPARGTIQVLVVVGERVRADDLRRIPMARLEQELLRAIPHEIDVADLPPLERRGKTPEDFARLFVQHYNAWSERDPHPVNRMAAEYGINRRTLHSWLRECRLRGLVPAPERSASVLGGSDA